MTDPEPKAYWHDRELPGSPAYARRLRDRAAVAIYASAGSSAEAVNRANALIAALGYPVPGEEGKDE